MTNNKILAVAMLTAVLVTGTFSITHAYSTSGDDKKSKPYDKQYKFYDDDEHDDDKLTICHIPHGNPSNGQTISVSKSALKDHLNHGDSVGTCNSNNAPKNATITLFNAITTDNGATIPSENAFALGITGISNPMFATTYIVPADTPITIQISTPDGFTRVIISGDHCPTVSEFDDGSTTLMLKKDQDLVCTIYYDDNGTQTTPSGPGVIFHFDNQRLKIDSNGLIDPTSTNVCSVTNTAPCLDFDSGILTVVPDLSNVNQQLSDTTVVIFTVIPVGSDTNPTTTPPFTDCIFSSLGKPQGSNLIGFQLACPTLSPSVNSDWNVNYALIETQK